MKNNKNTQTAVEVVVLVQWNYSDIVIFLVCTYFSTSVTLKTYKYSLGFFFFF